MTWIVVQLVSRKLDAAIERGHVVPAVIVRSPEPIDKGLIGGSHVLGAIADVLGVLLRLLGFPTVLVEFEFAWNGTEYPRRSSFLFEDEQIVQDDENVAFALVDPRAPRRLSWVCRRSVGAAQKKKSGTRAGAAPANL